MIVPIFFYAKCDPTYQTEVLDPLEKEIADIQEMPGEEFTEEKADLIKAAVCKYADWNIIQHEYWSESISYLEEIDDEWPDEMEQKALDHYDHGYNPVTNDDDSDSVFYYLMDAGDRFYDEDCPKEPVHDFPHNSIDRMFFDYQKNVMTYHPTKEILEKRERMKKLYFEINAAESDTEKWFNLLLGVNIDQFLRTNVEYRLGFNLLDRQLWKLYIDYLKDRDPKALLQVYSRYVRFFMDDKEILGEYKQQMEEHGPVELFWKKLLEFEKQPHMLGPDESADEDMMNSSGHEEMNITGGQETDSMDEDMMSSTGEEDSNSSDEEMETSDEDDNLDVSSANPPFNPLICATFFNNVNRQKEFSFLKPTSEYIFEKASPAVLQKLFKCGKYFFARKSTPICYRLVVHDDMTAFNEESVALNYLDDIVLNEVLISYAMKIQWLSGEAVPETFKMFTSNLIPHLSRCDAKFIKLDNQNLSYKELKFLLESGNCIELELPKCEIKDENGEYVEWEKIMELLPKFTNLVLPTVKFNCNTAHALSLQKFENKVAYIKIKNVVGKPFDAEEFKNFLAKRFFRIDLVFDPSFNANFVATFNQIIEEH